MKTDGKGIMEAMSESQRKLLEEIEAIEELMAVWKNCRDPEVRIALQLLRKSLESRRERLLSTLH